MQFLLNIHRRLSHGPQTPIERIDDFLLYLERLMPFQAAIQKALKQSLVHLACTLLNLVAAIQQQPSG